MSPTPRTLNILLLRHGLTDANSTGVIQGHQPVPLNATGHDQARRLARRLADFSPPIDALISSDLSRAHQTAQPIAAALKLPLRLDPAWRERAFGQWEGKNIGDINIWRAASGEADPPGAESTTAFFSRIRTALLQLPQAYPHATTVAVVTHGGPVRVLAQMLSDARLPLHPESPRPELTSIANCSIMHLVYSGSNDTYTFHLSCMNDTRHLEPKSTTLTDAG